MNYICLYFISHVKHFLFNGHQTKITKFGLLDILPTYGPYKTIVLHISFKCYYEDIFVKVGGFLPWFYSLLTWFVMFKGSKMRMRASIFTFDPGYPNLLNGPGKHSEYRIYESPKVRAPTGWQRLLAQDILLLSSVGSGESLLAFCF